MDFVIVSALFILFMLGCVLMFQALVGHEIRSEGAAFGRPFDPEHPGPSHPPEKHPWRLAGVGFALVVIVIVLGVVLL